ncbi:NAD-dependent protein deacetylase Sirt6-like [Dermacentor andersoni]|uniref:NAD-dependent protein deacetylase Sirt6-like n=1 Tax=Dermacentor andersoni TaxID=34620 RepID=UPI0021554747|nr:NAD-dependent protein deacetylase Sirt6-like [Dermacentor andersoni]
MSCDYASGLSEYADKGICGQPEHFDEPSLLEDKIARLADWMQASKHIVVITGAGISTSAGIPDFRGPRGVWTLEQQGEKPQVNISFDDAVPTSTHMALVELARSSHLKFLVSQNVDGLHLKSGFPMDILTDLHGNMFLDRCNQCGRQFVRTTATKSVGQKPTGESCPVPKKNGRLCRGHLHDSILDWEHELPEDGIEAADLHCRAADLILCLGSTLQIVPCGALPLLAKKTGGKIVICNLQPTKIDKSANLILRAYVDDVMEKLMKRLGIAIPTYSAECDPTKIKREAPMEYPKLRLPDAKAPAPRKYKKKPRKRESSTSPDDATARKAIKKERRLSSTDATG